MLDIFLLLRYKAGLRAKGATAVTAGLRIHFARSLEPTGFLDAAVISTTRQACRLNPSELRAMRNSGISDTVKLPAWQGMLVHLRDVQSWTGDGLIQRLTYLACVWGFDQSALVSKYTIPEPRAVDHCIRLDDVSFHYRSPEIVICIAFSQEPSRASEMTAH